MKKRCCEGCKAFYKLTLDTKHKSDQQPFFLFLFFLLFFCFPFFLLLFSHLFFPFHKEWFLNVTYYNSFFFLPSPFLFFLSWKKWIRWNAFVIFNTKYLLSFLLFLRLIKTNLDLFFSLFFSFWEKARFQRISLKVGLDCNS